MGYETSNTRCAASEAATELDGSNLRRTFPVALKTGQVRDLRFQALRHIFATQLVKPLRPSATSNGCSGTNLQASPTVCSSLSEKLVGWGGDSGARKTVSTTTMHASDNVST